MKRYSLMSMDGWLRRAGVMLLVSVIGPAAAHAQTSAAPCTPKAQQSGPVTQGRSLQGRSLQGRSLQGRSLQGRSLQGTSLQGAEPAVATVKQVLMKGAPVQNLQLRGTVLVGSLNGKEISGTDFIGATLIQEDVDGSQFQATISKVQIDPQDASCEVMLYTLTTTNPTTGAAEDLCDADPFSQSWATPVYGSWDITGAHIPSTTKFMFACTSGVIAKCIRWGYRPWKTVNGRSLMDYHQTCTRMARADYCGDGVSHTEDGTLIDMYDNLKIQKKSPIDLKKPLLFDAAWTPRGAYCVTKDRWLNLSRLESMAVCKAKFTQILPLVESSPIDLLDVCLVKRGDLSRKDVLMDNQSGINIKLK